MGRDLIVYFRLRSLNGFRRSLFDGCRKVFYRLTFRKTQWEIDSDPSKSDEPDFSDQILKAEVKRSDYESEVIDLTIVGEMSRGREQELGCVNIPLVVCRVNRRIRPKFQVTMNPENVARVTAAFALHITDSSSVAPFAAEAMTVDMSVLQDFATRNGLGAVVRSSHGTKPPPTPPSSGPRSSGGRPNDSGRPSDSGRRPAKPSIPLEKRITPRQLAAVETAIATAPAMVWKCFANKTFLQDCLRYYRVPGAPPERAQ